MTNFCHKDSISQIHCFGYKIDDLWQPANINFETTVKGIYYLH